MDSFKLVSPYKAMGDQPEAIDKLVNGIENGIDEATDTPNARGRLCESILEALED